jgi:hypothetical protein
MKRIGILVTLLFFAFALSSLASAGINDCASGQTILKIWGLTNAHGETFSGTATKSICYKDVFGKDYTGATPHNCLPNNNNPTNFVLALAGTINAHASKTATDTYATKVCYGDLKCTVKASCVLGELTVAKLSGDGTNSHIEVREGNVYSNRICCSSAFANVNNPAVCGNGIIEQGEQCDGTNLGTPEKKCIDLQGFNGGTLSCKANCEFNTDACTSPGGGSCGDGTCDPGETHDTCPNDCPGGPIVEKGCKTKKGSISCNLVNENYLNDILKADDAYSIGKNCDRTDTACKCEWRASDTTCIFKKISPPTDDQNDNPPGCTNICDSTSQNGACVDGYLTVKITSTYSGTCALPDPTCQSQEKTLICGSPTIKLPFFDNLQIITSIVALGLLYAIFIATKRK